MLLNGFHLVAQFSQQLKCFSFFVKFSNQLLKMSETPSKNGCRKYQSNVIQ